MRKAGMLLSIMLVGALSAPAGARDGGHLVAIVETDGATFDVTSVIARPEVLPRPERTTSARYLVSAWERDALLITVPVRDPLQRWYDTGSPERLQGGRYRQPVGAFAVRVPPATTGLTVLDRRTDARSMVLGLGPAVSPPFRAQPVRAAAPPHEAVDIVVLGDGYRAEDRSAYAADTDRIVGHLFSEPPFSEYAAFFNLHRIDVVSAEAGTDHWCDGTFVDTALDTGFIETANAPDCRLLTTTSGYKVLEAAASAPEADLIVVIVNTETYGGSGGPDYAITYSGSAAGEVNAHEIGHTFGLLADEYGYPGGPYVGVEPLEQNVSMVPLRSTWKWSGWVEPARSGPASDEGDDLPGYYEGARYRSGGIFRPTFDSKMRSLFRPFERVNHSLLVRRIFELGPVDEEPPAVEASVVGQADGQVTVRVDALDHGSYVHAFQVSSRPDFADGALAPASNEPSFTSTVTRPRPVVGGFLFVRVYDGAGNGRTVIVAA